MKTQYIEINNTTYKVFTELDQLLVEWLDKEINDYRQVPLEEMIDVLNETDFETFTNQL